MWDKAVNRQYNLFGTLLMFLITTLSVVGSIISSSKIPLSITEKELFSGASTILFSSVIALLRMVHIERNIAFKAEPPKSSDTKLQNEENCLRLYVNFSIAFVLLLTLFLVNLMVWNYK